jgi:stage III sporulation protein AA
MQQIYNILPTQVKERLPCARWCELMPEEIRFRIHAPVLISAKGNEYFIKASPAAGEDSLTNDDTGQLLCADSAMLSTLLESVCEGSLYAYQDEIRQGFLTYQGGHRIGVCGKAVVEENKIKGLSYITYCNIRIAQEQKDCAKQIVPMLFEQGKFLSTLIFSAPGAGKTTFLRDCIRLLSNKTFRFGGLKIAVVDERGEIAACYEGIPQKEVGIRTDVLDGGKKSEGMMYLLRSMSPQVMAVDELGKEEDYQALEEVLVSGCRFLATVHADNVEELVRKPYLREWIADEKFKRLVHITKEEDGARSYAVYNGAMEKLC